MSEADENGQSKIGAPLECQESLCAAAAAGHVDIVRQLHGQCDDEAQLNEAFFAAVEANQHEVVDFFLSNKLISVDDATSQNGDTPLMAAVLAFNNSSANSSTSPCSEEEDETRPDEVGMRLINTLFHYHPDLRMTNSGDGNTAVHLAAKHWKVQVVEYLLGRSTVCDDLVNAQNKRGETPLILAMKNLEPEKLSRQNNNKEEASSSTDKIAQLVEILKKAKADFNLFDDDGNCALFYAFEMRSRQAITQLIKNGSDPSLAHFQRKTAFTHLGASDSKTTSSELLFEIVIDCLQAEIVEQSSESDKTAVLLGYFNEAIDAATSTGNLDFIDHVLRVGFVKRILDNDWLNQFLVSLCENSKNFPVVRIAVMHGAKKSARDKVSGNTPLLNAFSHQCVEIIEYCCNRRTIGSWHDFEAAAENNANNFGNSILHVVAAKSWDDGFKHVAWLRDVYLERGLADRFVEFVNLTNKDGDTALGLAVRLNNASMTGELIRFGASVNLCRRKDNYSPLAIAVAQKFNGIKQMLLDAGAKLTALPVPCSINTEWLMLLKASGASENPGSSNNVTNLKSNSKDQLAPAAVATIVDKKSYLRDQLLSSVSSKNLKQVRDILKNRDGKRYINERMNADGKTLLMIAAANGDLTMVKELVGYGADTALRDNSGKTARLIVIEKGLGDIAKFFNEKGIRE